MNSLQNSRPEKRMKIRGVSWPPDEKLRQIRVFRIDDPPYYVGNTQGVYGSTDSRSQDPDLPPGFGHLAKRVQTLTRAIDNFEADIRWHEPPKVTIDAKWKVTGPEESDEIEIQSVRTKSNLESFYPHPSVIPASPREPDVEVEYDDSKTSIIPIDPLETVDDLPDVTDLGDQLALVYGKADVGIPVNSSDSPVNGGSISWGKEHDVSAAASDTHRYPSRGFRDQEPGENLTVAAATAIISSLIESVSEDDSLLTNLLADDRLQRDFVAKKVLPRISASRQNPNNKIVPVPSREGEHGTARPAPLPSAAEDNVSFDVHHQRDSGAIGGYLRPQTVSHFVTERSSWQPIRDSMNPPPGHDEPIMPAYGSNGDTFGGGGYAAPPMHHLPMSRGRPWDGSRGRGSFASGRGRSKRPCLYFNTVTGCKNGNDCPFVHDVLLEGPNIGFGRGGDAGRGRGRGRGRGW